MDCSGGWQARPWIRQPSNLVRSRGFIYRLRGMELQVRDDADRMRSCASMGGERRLSWFDLRPSAAAPDHARAGFGQVAHGCIGLQLWQCLATIVDRLNSVCLVPCRIPRIASVLPRHQYAFLHWVRCCSTD